MFRFFEKMFIRLLSVFTVGSFGESLVPNLEGPITCVSLNNHPCQSKPTLANINSNEALLYPFTSNTCVGSCNTIHDPYAQV